MTPDNHMRDLVWQLVVQLCSKDALIDAQTAEIIRLQKFEPKPKKKPKKPNPLAEATETIDKLRPLAQALAEYDAKKAKSNDNP